MGSVDSLQSTVQNAGFSGYFIIGLMAFLEAFILTSLFSLGTEVVIMGGALCAGPAFNIWIMIIFVTIGSTLGSELSYYAGVYSNRFVSAKRRAKLLKHPTYLKAKSFFDERGEVSIIFAHFLGPVRPVIPTIAGFLKMPPSHFHLYNAIGAISYSVIFIVIGYYFGDVFSNLSPTAKRYILIGIVLVVLAIIVWVLFQFFHHNKEKDSAQ